MEYVLRKQRGMNEIGQIEYNPYLMKNMSESVERLSKAINNREKIVIYGYYDVDGITAVSLLLLLLKYLNADVEYFIPESFINKDMLGDFLHNGTEHNTSKEEIEMIKNKWEKHLLEIKKSTNNINNFFKEK